LPREKKKDAKDGKDGKDEEPSSPGPGAYNTTSLTGRMNLGLGCILFETVSYVALYCPVSLWIRLQCTAIGQVLM